MRWRDGLAIAFTAGAVAGSAAVVGHAVPENNRPLVILAALTALLTVAGQTAIRREMFERLAESRKYWFRSSPRGLAEVDADLQFVEGNSRLASLLAVQEIDLPGRRLTAFFDEHDVVGIVAQFRRLLDGAVETIESDDMAIRNDNARIWLHWRATAVRRRNGSFEHFVITFEDSTQKHVAEEAAHANLAELEKLNHMKTEFTSMVSHEFRTALTGIQGMSELINGGDMKPDEVHEYSGYIFQEAERVNRLINDMLDIDRLEAGKMKLQMSLWISMRSSKGWQCGALRRLPSTRSEQSSRPTSRRLWVIPPRLRPPDEMLARLAGLRQARVGRIWVPHKPSRRSRCFAGR